MSEDRAARPYGPAGNPGSYPPPNAGWNQSPYPPYAPGNAADQHQPAYGNQPPPYQQPYAAPSQAPYQAPYNETSGEQRQILATKGRRALVFGALWLVGGLLLSLITYSMAARGGGVYFVAYGPVIYGIYRVVTGIVMLNRSKR